MLVIKNVTKSFGSKKILNNINLSVKPGEIAFLLGSSGVGKSTLLRMLNNLETVDTGVIELDGTLLDVSRVNRDHTVGMVFQHWNLFDHLTVQENITLALKHVLKKSQQESEHIANTLLENYGLLEKSGVYPSQLSGGQKQRLALARTLALQPKIICLDEPTSALDPLLTTHIAKIINQLGQQGYIVLVASHDVSLLKRLECTIYLMEHGNIVESAASSELFAHPERYDKLAHFMSGEEKSSNSY